MKFRLRRVGVLKAAVVGGIAYAIMGLVFVPFFFFMALFAPAGSGMGAMPGEWAMGGAFALLLPVIYGVMGFVFTAIGAAIYNLIAMMMGGLEIELQREGGEPATLTPATPVY